MCGFTGAYARDGGEAVSRDALVRMTGSLRHRGPDGEGYFLDRGVALGHRRLTIIDLATGDQPKARADGSVVLVFNGEIYNYRELRKELEGLGRAFRTQSDTEVILEAYATWGEECVTRLRGMFAFALWDRARRSILLARDRVGIKPLYYSWDGNRLLFGSEIKSILAEGSVARDIDPAALDEYLTYLYVPAPRSIFRAIRKLRPGHILVVSDRGLEEREYWDLVFEPKPWSSEEACAEELLETVRESVRVHLVSDVPLGAFLSGGIDSSAVVGLMAGLMNEPVKTASIGFEESGFDELPWARQVAERFRTDRYERVVRPRAAEIMDTLAWHYDEPFADSSMIPTYYVSQAARDRVTVALSGDGGDENFAGYRRYRFDVFENRVRSAVSPALLRPLARMSSQIYPKADWLPRIFRAKTTLQNLSLSPERAYAHTMSWFTPDMKRHLYGEALRRELNGHDPFDALAPHFERSRGWDPLSRIQYVDIKSYLVDDILTKVDRASMAHSLEVRVPLLDHVVMEYAAGIPACWKLQGGEGKHIFKKALRPVLPDEVLYRPKMGFTIPLARWLRQDLRPMFEASVLRQNSFLSGMFDPAPIRRWWGEHQRGQRDHSNPLYALLVLEAWGRRHMDGEAGA
jgi:asparagine synthase (glutamine-hydrolysing)